MPDSTITLRTRADLAAIQQMDAAFQDLSKQEQKATKDALSLAQSFARLDTAMGAPAEGAARLRATLDGLGAAEAKQATAIQAQITKLESLAAAQDKAAQAARTRAAAEANAKARQELDAQRQALTPPERKPSEGAGLAGLAVGALVGKQALDFAVAAGQSALALRETQNSLRAVAGDTKTYNTILDEAHKQQILFGGSLQDNIEGLQGLAISARTSGANLTTLIDLQKRLAILDPAQGAGGARIALNEALSGDPTSLAKRYEIPRAALAKLRDTSLPVADRLNVINEFLNKAGITSDSVASKVDKSALAYRTLSASFDQAKTAGGGFLADALVPLANAGSDLLGGKGFAGFLTGAQSFTRVMVGLPPVTDAAAQSQENLTNKVLTYLGIAKEAPAPTSILQSADAADRAAEANARLAQQAQFVGGAMDAERQAAAGLQVATGLAASDIQRSAEASIKDAAQKDLQAQKTALLKAETQQTVDAFIRLNPGIDASAAASLAAAQGYTPQIQQLIAIQIEADKARFALANMNLEKALATGAGPGPDRSLGGGPTIGAAGLGGGAGATGNQIFAQNNALRDSQNQLALASTKSHQARIGILQSELAQTTDQIKKNNILAQIEGEKQAIEAEKLRSTKAHTSELQKQQTLTESIYDSENKRKQALIDIQRLGAEDTLQDLKDKQDRRVLQNFLNSGRGSQDFRTAAAAQLDLINAKDADRGLKLDEARATAGAGLSSRGTLLQSRAGGVPAAAAAGNAPPSAAGAPTATTPSGGGNGLTVVFAVDGKTVATGIVPDIMDKLLQGIQTVAAQRGL